VKSARDLAAWWAKQWQIADTGEARLPDADVWPVSLPMGKPTSHELTHKTIEVRGEEVIRAAKVALPLSHGCAEGRPLRALSILGTDSKFFGRHRALLVAALTPGLLPFARQRVPGWRAAVGGFAGVAPARGGE